MKLRWIVLALMLVCSEMGYGQVTFFSDALLFPQIAVGGDADGANYVTLIQIVNNNSTPITTHIALFSNTGSPLTASFDGGGANSTLDLTLSSGATKQILITLSGPITPGWMGITYSPSGASTTVILQFRSGTTLLSEVGVDPSADTIAATDFAAETDAALNTGIAIANPSNVTEYVLARLWDPATGTQSTNSVLTLPPNGHIAQFLTEIFPNVLNISQLRAQISLDSCSSSTCNFGGGPGFIATALRLNGDQFTTIPIAERAPAGDIVRVLPQVAFGGPSTGLNMKTVLYFTTNVSSGVFGTAEIFDNDGNALAASADGAAPSGAFTFTVPGRRISKVVLSGDQTLRSGWIRLTMPSTVHLIASAVFQTFNGSTLASEASVLDAAPVQRGLVYVSVRSGANVGIALANSQSSANTVTVDLFNADGFPAGSRDIELAPNGHLARFVTEIFPELASVSDFDGALSIHSSSSFSALALRLSGDKVATLPVAADGMYRPSITSIRVTRTQRTIPAQVNFDIDVSDFNNDLATSSSTSVTGFVIVDFGSSVGQDYGNVTIDGAPMITRSTGTLSGSFQLPRVTTTIPSGFSAALYVVIYDSVGNTSNLIAVPFKF